MAQEARMAGAPHRRHAQLLPAVAITLVEKHLGTLDARRAAVLDADRRVMVLPARHADLDDRRGCRGLCHSRGAGTGRAWTRYGCGPPYRAGRAWPTSQSPDRVMAACQPSSESQPDWVPSLPRNPAVLSRPVRSLRPPLAPSARGQALSPRRPSHLPELSITRRHRGFTHVHPPGLPPRL